MLSAAEREPRSLPMLTADVRSGDRGEGGAGGEWSSGRRSNRGDNRTANYTLRGVSAVGVETRTPSYRHSLPPQIGAIRRLKQRSFTAMPVTLAPIASDGIQTRF